MVGNSLKYTLNMFKKNIKNGMALKTDFIITIFGMFINDIAFIIIWLSFTSTAGVINGWNGNDIFGLFGFTFISYGVTRSFFGGLGKLPDLIFNGGLDRFLYTPKNLILKISTSNFIISALGDLLCGIACLIIYLSNINVNITVISLTVLLLIISCLINFAFLLLTSSLCFHFMDGRELSRIIEDLFVLPTTYNGGIIQGILRTIYTFFIPALLAGGLAVELIKNITLEKLLLILGVTIIWVIFSIIFFYRSLKKYESSNFMTFGTN